MRESCEARPVEIDGERLVRGAQSINSHVELTSTEQKRVQQVSLTNIWLWWVIPIERFPLGNIANLVKYENSLPLALAGLHRRSLTGFMIHNVLLSF